MRDDPASLALSSSTDANFVQQHERRPGRACRSTPRDAYDAEVGHGRKVLDCSPADKNNSDRKKKGKKQNVSLASGLKNKLK